MRLNRKLISLFLLVIFSLSLTAVAFAEEASGTKETDSDAKIKIEVQHALLTQGEGVALVKEVIKFKNDGDTYVGKGEGEQKEVLRISLPQNYTNLRILGVPENKTIIREGELITTTPVSPGTLQLELSYAIPKSQYNDFILNKKINYITDVLYILSPVGELNIKGEGIQSAGVQEIDGEKFQVFYNEVSRPGEQFQLTAAPGKGSEDRVSTGYTPSTTFHSAGHISRWMNSPLAGSNPHVWLAFLGLLIFTIIIAAGMLIKEKRKVREKQENEEKLATLYDRLVIKEKRLMDKIKDLDSQLAKGEVAGETHSGLREQYKKMLVDVKLKLRELEDLEI